MLATALCGEKTAGHAGPDVFAWQGASLPRRRPYHPRLLAVRPEKSRRRAGTEHPQRPRASDSAALRPGSPWPRLRAHWSAAPLCLSGLSTMLRTTALLAALCGANALSLTSENWDEMVAKTGKAAFVKFQAPW